MRPINHNAYFVNNTFVVRLGRDRNQIVENLFLHSKYMNTVGESIGIIADVSQMYG